jgi:membrane protease YdiL (CAAX protease family)
LTEASHKAKAAPLPAVLALVVVVYILQQLLLGARQSLAPDGNWLKVMVLANQLVSILLPVLAFVYFTRLPWTETLGLFKPPLRKTVIAVSGGIVLIYGVNAILPRIVPPTPVYSNMAGSIVSYSNAPEFLLMLLTIAVAAPLADELFFRGLLLHSLKARYGRIIAIVAVGALTALFHTFEPFKLTHSFIMAVIFSSAVVWTGSVWTSIILHVVHNGLSLIPG